MTGVFPDYPAPVIRNTNEGTEMTMMRWGMRRRRAPAGAVTNIRNTSSRRTGGLLKPENRCLVPFNSFGRVRAGAEP